jgi:hypothetical protein
MAHRSFLWMTVQHYWLVNHEKIYRQRRYRSFLTDPWTTCWTCCHFLRGKSCYQVKYVNWPPWSSSHKCWTHLLIHKNCPECFHWKINQRWPFWWIEYWSNLLLSSRQILVFWNLKLSKATLWRQLRSSRWTGKSVIGFEKKWSHRDWSSRSLKFQHNSQWGILRLDRTTNSW